MEELSNFTYLVFARIALFRLCVFRSVSVIFIICFEERKFICVFFLKVSLLHYSVIILKHLNSALGALTGLLKLLVIME